MGLDELNEEVVTNLQVDENLSNWKMCNKLTGRCYERLRNALMVDKEKNNDVLDSQAAITDGCCSRWIEIMNDMALNQKTSLHM